MKSNAFIVLTHYHLIYANFLAKKGDVIFCVKSMRGKFKDKKISERGVDVIFGDFASNTEATFWIPKLAKNRRYAKYEKFFLDKNVFTFHIDSPFAYFVIKKNGFINIIEDASNSFANERKFNFSRPKVLWNFQRHIRMRYFIFGNSRKIKRVIISNVNNTSAHMRKLVNNKIEVIPFDFKDTIKIYDVETNVFEGEPILILLQSRGTVADFMDFDLYCKRVNEIILREYKRNKVVVKHHPLFVNEHIIKKDNVHHIVSEFPIQIIKNIDIRINKIYTLNSSSAKDLSDKTKNGIEYIETK